MLYKQKFKTVDYVIAVNYLGNSSSGEFQQYQNSYILFNNVSSKIVVLFYRYSVLDNSLLKMVT